MPTRDMGTIRSDATLVAALGASASGWVDLGDRAETLEVVATATGGTYVLELDWSNDAGASQLAGSPFTVTPALGATTEIACRARWVRIRVRNTHATVAFSAHLTRVNVRERPLRRSRGGRRRPRRSGTGRTRG